MTSDTLNLKIRRESLDDFFSSGTVELNKSIELVGTSELELSATISIFLDSSFGDIFAASNAHKLAEILNSFGHIFFGDFYSLRGTVNPREVKEP